MTFDLPEILESKQKYRKRLAELPLEEKLAMLDVLRERTLLLRSAKKIEPQMEDIMEQPKTGMVNANE